MSPPNVASSQQYDEIGWRRHVPPDFEQHYEIHTFGAKGARPCGDDVIQPRVTYRAATTSQVPPKALTPSPLAEPFLP
jgi:hypothetical protein